LIIGASGWLFKKKSSESYLFPVTIEGEGKFQAECATVYILVLLDLTPCSVVLYWSYRGFCCSPLSGHSVTYCLIRPWLLQQQDTVNICILLLNCIASYQKSKKKTSRRLFDTEFRRI